MDTDHLDRETSVSVGVTSSGVEAKAKSRTVAAVDRLVGSLFDRLSAPLEGKAAEERAKSQARIELIKAMQAVGIEQLTSDPEFAARAIEGQLGAAFRRQANKEAVVKAAMEDLRDTPPTEEQAAVGPDALDEGFINRFERYAEEASDDALRAKWGRVLAAEVRNPGNINAKAMRIVDELSPSTALLFEKICNARIGDIVIKCLLDELSFDDRNKLVTSDLIIDPGLTGQVSIFSDGRDGSRKDLWILYLGSKAISVEKGASIHFGIPKDNQAIGMNNGSPVVPVFVLTEAGLAISQIIKNNEDYITEAYADKLSKEIPSCEIRIYTKVDVQYVYIKSIIRVN